MSRALRVLTASTALAVAAALVPPTAGAATATITGTSAATERPTAPAPRSSAGITIGDSAVSSPAFSRIRTASARTTWPVGSGKVDLGPDDHTMAPTGAPAQRLVTTKLRYYRGQGGYMEASVNLGAAPDASTPSWVLIAWGKVSSDGTRCNSPSGSNILFTSTDTDTKNNPVYQGSNIKVRPFQFPAARENVYTCAFTKTATDNTFATPYDSLGGDVTSVRQKPVLSVRISDRKISSRAFTTIPVVVSNSSSTVATAFNTRIKVTARGLSYRFNPAVGTIRPGASRKGSIQLKYTSRYKSYFVITLRSGDYVKKVKYIVTPVPR